MVDFADWAVNWKDFQRLRGQATLPDLEIFDHAYELDHYHLEVGKAGLPPRI